MGIEINKVIDKDKIEDLVEKYKTVLNEQRKDDFSEEDVKNKFLISILFNITPAGEKVAI